MGTSFISWLTLQVMTLVVIVVDRALPYRKPLAKPKPGAVIILSLLLNVAALPYYFGKSRQSFLGVLAGLGLFIVAFAIDLMVLTPFILAGYR